MLSEYKNMRRTQLVENLLSNVALLFIVVWFELSVDAILGYVLLSIATIILIAAFHLIRTALKVDGFIRLHEAHMVMFVTLFIASIAFTSYAYAFIFYDLESSSVIVSEATFSIIFAIAVIATIMNRSLREAGNSLGLTLFYKNKLLIMIASLLVPIMFTIATFSLLNVMDSSTLTGAVILMSIKFILELYVGIKSEAMNIPRTSPSSPVT